MFCEKCGNQIGQGDNVCSKCGNIISPNAKAFCRNCGSEIKEGSRFCVVCGTPTPNNVPSFCLKCGTELERDAQFCRKCGNPVYNNANINYRDSTQNNGKDIKKDLNVYRRCLSSFIIGLIGSIFGMFGGLCTSMCSCGSASNTAFIFIFGGSIVGMIGSCMCLNKAKIGSIFQVCAALVIAFRAYNGGADFMTVIAWLFLLIAGIIGIVKSFVIDKSDKK